MISPTIEDSGRNQLRHESRKRLAVRTGGESERDDVGNAGEGANGTLAHEAPQARFTEVLRPKATLWHEVIVGLLQDDKFQAAIPFAPRRHRRPRTQSVGDISTRRRLLGGGGPLT